jgi:hypothetical protein
MGLASPALEKRINILQNDPNPAIVIVLSPAPAEIFLAAEPTQPPRVGGSVGNFTPVTFDNEFGLSLNYTALAPSANATADIAWTHNVSSSVPSIDAFSEPDADHVENGPHPTRQSPRA